MSLRSEAAMKYLVLCFQVLFVVSTSSALKVDAPSSIKLDRGAHLKIQCNVSEASAVTVEWKKDNGPVSETRATLTKPADLKNGIYTLAIKSPNDKDLGNYTCSFRDGDSTEPEERTIQVTGQVLVKVPSNINVVEGEKLRIHCQVAGGAAPDLVWSFTPDGLDNRTAITSEGRYTLEEDEHKIPNSILIVKDITMNDRGHFECSDSEHTVSSKTMVRVKDKYAALWPFLGIVAEVVILCAIIFVYEKKHNKAELDESDTDQSPDQKNTPDHGKDGLRHRQ